MNRTATNGTPTPSPTFAPVDNPEPEPGPGVDIDVRCEEVGNITGGAVIAGMSLSSMTMAEASIHRSMLYAQRLSVLVIVVPSISPTIVMVVGEPPMLE